MLSARHTDQTVPFRDGPVQRRSPHASVFDDADEIAQLSEFHSVPGHEK